MDSQEYNRREALRMAGADAVHTFEHGIGLEKVTLWMFNVDQETRDVFTWGLIDLREFVGYKSRSELWTRS